MHSFLEMTRPHLGATPPGEDAFLARNEKINDRLMFKKKARFASLILSYLFCLFTFHRFQIPNDRVVVGEGDGVVDAYSEGLEVRGAEYIVNAHVDSIAIE